MPFPLFGYLKKPRLTISNNNKPQKKKIPKKTKQEALYFMQDQDIILE